MRARELFYFSPLLARVFGPGSAVCVCAGCVRTVYGTSRISNISHSDHDTVSVSREVYICVFVLYQYYLCLSKYTIARLSLASSSHWLRNNACAYTHTHTAHALFSFLVPLSARVPHSLVLIAPFGFHSALSPRLHLVCLLFLCLHVFKFRHTPNLAIEATHIQDNALRATNTTSNMQRQKKANCTDSKWYGETIGLRIIIVYRVRAILFCIYYIPHTHPMPHRSTAEWNAKC